jgi:hypothetical protein
LWLLPGEAALAQQAPPDFKVTLTSGPARPARPLAVESVTIHADDTATVSARLKDGKSVPARTTRLRPGSAHALHRLLTRERFFDLKPLYRDERVQDGDYAVLRVTAAGRTHEVRTVNMRVKAFDRIALWVNSYFEPGDMVLYNSFLGLDSQEVER